MSERESRVLKFLDSERDILDDGFDLLELIVLLLQRE